MDLRLLSRKADLKSASQIARVATEGWAVDCFYCPSCGSGLRSYPPGMRVYDFFSPECKEQFQMKSADHPLSRSVLGSEYHTTLNSVQSNRFPSLMLLHYDRIEWVVEDLCIVHRACITESCIIPRKPLSESARRAGWQGCLISIDKIPKLGQIDVVSQGTVREKTSVLAQWRQASSLLKAKPEYRGWLADVLGCVERLPASFTLDDVYVYAEELSKKHPKNHNIRPKIRQQLQVLRDLGLLRFVRPGVYEYAGALTGGTPR